MISREEAERLAARWARDESVRRERPVPPVVEEIAPAGWFGPRSFRRCCPHPAKVPDGHRQGNRRGHQLASPVAGVCGRAAPAAPATSCGPPHSRPVSRARRSMRLRPGPTVIAELTLNGRRHLARGAKGDQELQHHPLVRATSTPCHRGIWSAVGTSRRADRPVGRLARDGSGAGGSGRATRVRTGGPAAPRYGVLEA